MNEWFKKLFDQIKTIWSKWSALQRIIFIGVGLAAIAGVTALILFSASPSMEPILTQPVTDETLRQQIGARLDTEGIEYEVTADNILMVKDRPTALRARAILSTQGLLPGDTDPWALFDMDRWTITDYERDVNLRRSITNQLIQHIEALDDVDDASVSIVMPEKTLFSEDQDPVTASIIITPKPGSDIAENRTELEGIQELVQFAVPGLTADYITISDTSGRKLNDFEGMADFDRLALNKRELELKRDLEQQYIRQIKNSLSGIFTKDRIEILNIEVDLDYGNRQTEKEEYFPIVVTPDNPATPFSERETTLNVLRSRENFDEDYQGSGFNPEGPPGVEGQTPPSYQDLEGLVGEYSRSQDKENFEINRQVTTETGSPSIERISVGVAIDGVWQWQYLDNGQVDINPDGSINRSYTPVSQEQLDRATELIQGAVGFSQNRGDVVTVRTIPFDRSEQHRAEDDEFRKRQQTQQIILFSLLGIVVLLIIFIVFRLITREIERRRRLREEELARQHQAMREAALRSAEEESAEVEMSVEERARLEMQENAINMAREHPEDVAQLIRTWLMEE
ncbi:flagellar basal-body MS-ring/collar protein FliF [Salinispira pacifica]|uniref:Flagellar M-ring protein n=1 Tax=Salinispira pacifica TaxID=1307761 RepID=V5WFM5_9SPIO|nr:flagellar basal-body MS-ring/collar protein FliF [Salinispira pacifica]AHC14578.1 Flagellar M-ring protein FliF [Salinispira pacifica]